MSYYNNYLSCREYRAQAAQICNRQKGKLVVIYLLYFLLVASFTLIEGLTGIGNITIDDGVVTFTSGSSGIFNLIFGGAFTLSFIKINKKLQRNEWFSVEYLFSGFHYFWKAFLIKLLTTIYIFLWSLLLVIPGIIKSFSYSLAMYIANDNPNLSANECITRSKELMQGNKFKLFKLLLSYFGWILLCGLTLGILSLWVIPRIDQAIYLFYLDTN
jgi:uncharacterized membrane protein